MRQTGLITIGLALGAAMLAGGCSSIRDHRGYLVDPALVDAIQTGVDNQMSVERALGRPTFVSQFGQQDWFYVSMDTKQRAFRRPSTNQQMIMRVRFDDKGNVAAIDRRSMEKVVRLDPDGDKTPTLGKDRSLLDDLFSNIGTVGAPGAGTGDAGGGPGRGPNGS